MERAQEIARSQPDPEALALQPVATDRRRRTLAVVLAAALGGVTAAPGTVASLDPVTAPTLAERCADHLPANAFPPSMLCMAEHGIPLMLPLLVDWPPHEVEAAERACIDLATEIPAPLKAWFQCLRDNGARVSLLAPTLRSMRR